MNTQQAHNLVLSILEERGTAGVIFTNHAVAKMAEREIEESDVIRTLQSDAIEALQRGNRDIKFKVKDEEFAVVFAFQGSAMVIVITTWRESQDI